VQPAALLPWANGTVNTATMSSGVATLRDLLLQAPIVGVVELVASVSESRALLGSSAAWQVTSRIEVIVGSATGMRLLFGNATQTWFFGASRTNTLAPSPTVIVTDAAGNHITDDRALPAAVVLTYQNTPRAVAAADGVVNSDGSQYVDQVMSRSAFAVNGLYAFSDVPTRGVHGRTYDLRFAAQGTAAISSLVVRDIPVERCPEAEYAVPGTDECSACPARAICDGTTELLSQPDAYRATTHSLQFYSCEAPKFGFDACLGEDRCEEGHTGPRCAVCKPGYGRDGDSCRECSSGAWNWVIMALLLALLLLLAYALIQSSMYRTINEKKLSGLAKMFLSHLQLMATAGLSLSTLPPFLERFYRGQQTFSALNPNFAFITCEVAPTFYDLWLIMAVLPWALIAVFVLEAGLRIACRQYSTEEEEEREARREELRKVLGDDLEAQGDDAHLEAMYRAYAYERDRNRTELMTGATGQPFFAIAPDMLEAAIREQELRQRRSVARHGSSANLYMGSSANLRKRGSMASVMSDESYDAIASLEGSEIGGSGSEDARSAAYEPSDMGSDIDESPTAARSRRQSIRKLRRASSVVFASGADGDGGAMASINIAIPQDMYDREAQRKRRERRRKRDKNVARNEDGTRKGKCAEFSEVMCVTTIIILFLLFPTLLEMNGRMLQCEDIDYGRFGTRSYLIADRAIRCDTDTHATYERVATLMFVGYAVLVPTFAVGIVKVMAHLTMKGSMEASRKAFFFMTGGLHPNRWWWEGWVTTRKAVLVAAFLFISHDRLRIYIDMWFIAIAICISNYLRPFQDKRVGYLELLSLVAIFATFNLGLLFDVYERGSPQFTAVATVIFVMNVLVILCFIAAIIYVARLVVLEMLRDMGKDVRVPTAPEEDDEGPSIEEIEEKIEAMQKEYADLKTATDGVNARFRLMSSVIREIENSKLRDHTKVDAAIRAYIEFLESAKVRLTGFNSSPADIQALFERERRVLEAYAFAERQARATSKKLFQAKRGGARWGR